MKQYKISASILAANLTEIKKEIHILNELDIDSLHLDIMDGNFVPNISFGKDMVSAVRKNTKKPIKTHLMINNPENHIDDFIDAGSDTIIFHYESCQNHFRLIEYIKERNKRVGIALNPSTSEEQIKYLINCLDEVLIMTVEPGFCKQKFLSSQLQKISSLMRICDDRNDIDIAVDGGIDNNTAKLCKKEGANLFVVGSYLFKNKNIQQNVENLRKSI